jgi:hypothetical protein
MDRTDLWYLMKSRLKADLEKFSGHPEPTLALIYENHQLEKLCKVRREYGWVGTYAGVHGGQAQPVEVYPHHLQPSDRPPHIMHKYGQAKKILR